MSVSGLFPNGDGTDDFAKGLALDIAAKGDSPAGFDAASPANPPEFAKEPNPPPVPVLDAANPRLLPGVDGWPKVDAPFMAPKPDLPN